MGHELNRSIGMTMHALKRAKTEEDKELLKNALAHFNVARALLKLGYPSMARPMILIGERRLAAADKTNSAPSQRPKRLSPEEYAKLTPMDRRERQLQAGFAGQDAARAGTGSFLDRLGDMFGNQIGGKKKPKP